MAPPSRATPKTPQRVSFLEDAPKYSTPNSYCDMSFDVTPGGKPIDEVQKILQLLISTIKEIDDSAFVA